MKTIKSFAFSKKADAKKFQEKKNKSARNVVYVLAVYPNAYGKKQGWIVRPRSKK